MKAAEAAAGEASKQEWLDVAMFTINAAKGADSPMATPEEALVAIAFVHRSKDPIVKSDDTKSLVVFQTNTARLFRPTGSRSDLLNTKSD